MHDISNPVRPLLDAQSGHVLALEPQRTLLRFFKATDYLGEGGLACAIGAGDGQQLSLFNRQTDVFKGVKAIFVCKVDVFRCKQNALLGRLLDRKRLGAPGPYFLFVRLGELYASNALGQRLWRDGNIRVAHGGQVQRFPNTVFQQQSGGEQIIRRGVRQNFSIPH